MMAQGPLSATERYVIWGMNLLLFFRVARFESHGLRVASVSKGGAGQVAWPAGGTCMPRRELVDPKSCGDERELQAEGMKEKDRVK